MYSACKRHASAILILLLLLSFRPLKGQLYGNEWIDYTKVHVKFKISKSGIYRLGYFTLDQSFTDANVFLNKIPFSQFRIYCMGKEVPMYVKDQNGNGFFDIFDYVEFVGHPVDGTFDRELYTKPEYQRHTLNTYCSSDAFYFFTYRTSGTGLRYQDYVNSSPPADAPKANHEYVVSTAPVSGYAQGTRVLVLDKDVYMPDYTAGEGFCGDNFSASGDPTAVNYGVPLNTPDYDNTGFSPVLEAGVVGVSNFNYWINHHVKFMVGADNATPVKTYLDTAWMSTGPVTARTTLSPSEMGSQQTWVLFNSTLINNVPSSTVAFSHAILKYPKKYNLGDSFEYAYTEDSSTKPVNIEWSNYGDGFFSLPLVYDETNLNRIYGNYTIGQKKVNYTLPAMARRGKMYILDEAKIITLNANDAIAVKSLNMDDGVDKGAYLLITSKKLNSSPKEEVKDYANFWSGRYNVVTQEIEDLYDYFSYGMAHPLAIRHYCKYLLEKSQANTPGKKYKPQYLMLLGRGFDMNYNHGPLFATLKPHIQRNHIPAIGTPVSDNLFTAGLDGTLLEPAIPTGRLSADTSIEISDYLSKLKSYVNAIYNYEPWQKNVMHLSGGATPAQASTIQYRLKHMEKWVLNPPFAGRVYSYSKSAGSQVDPAFVTSIANNIAKGVTLVTFLGHGSSSVTDIDIGDPYNYLNNGRYPLFYFNGCQVGNPCIPVPLTYIPLSEKIVKAKNKGGIGFLGQTSLSELYTVANQMEEFYQVYFDTTRGLGIGDVVKQAIHNFQSPMDLLNRAHCEELFLQGDPAAPVYAPTLPDFAVGNGDIFIDPPNTIALQDSFRVGVIVRNYGLGSADSFTCNLTRIYPDGVTKRYFTKRHAMGKFVDTVFFVIRSKDAATGGDNVFIASLNPERTPVEFKYDNNEYTSSKINFPVNGVNLIKPGRFAIVGTDSVELVAEASDFFKQTDDVYFEIDTNSNFNSPVLISLDLKGTPVKARVFASWKLKLPVLRDSQVYYWRARLSSSKREGGSWATRSFTYIKNHPEGWMQNAAMQYNRKISLNEFDRLIADTISNTIQFSKVNKKIYIDCSYSSTSNLGVKESGFGSQDLNCCACDGEYGLFCIPWDGHKLVRTPLNPSILIPHCFWGRAWSTFGNVDDYQLYYSFKMYSAADQDEFIKFINALPDSTYVTIYTRLRSYADQWKPQVFDALHKIGCRMFDDTTKRTDDAMYVACGKKGRDSGVAEAHTFGRQVPYVQLEADMLGDGDYGTMLSEKIGPTNKFGALHFRLDKKTSGKYKDTVAIDVLGLKDDGSADVLQSEITASPLDLSSLNTQKYKFIQLRSRVSDVTDHSAPNLNNWWLTYDAVPEGTLYPDNSAKYQFYNDTLYEGDTLNVKLPFKNISKVAFRDSIRLDYTYSNKITREVLRSGTLRFAPLKPDSVFVFPFKAQTTGLSGTYSLQVTVNQYFSQPEMTLANNSAVLNFYVTRDIMNPLLDVTFDGRHILQGDIVSANPVIRIQSKDENKFLLQKDTSTIQLFVKKPGSATFDPVKWGGEAQFYPAAGKDNRARVEYKPADLPGGTYTLRVQSHDASNNKAGNTEYEIDFNVVREQSVTHFYPYPNPFTSSMRFVFTLTGTEVPEDIRVKIMTAEGRVVKEVTKDELGDIHVGNNITSWAWDGTDQYGDKLGNGTYFYKVTVKHNGEEVKLRASAGDASFKEQVGVIYLMR